MRRIRYGMVGGGAGAFIGEVHRMAARLDDCYELVCGAFSSEAERSVNSGTALGLQKSRCYPDYQTMFKLEAALPIDERMECAVIVTPNNSHYAIAVNALEQGFHVLSDKPATASLAECEALATVLANSKQLYGLTHTYMAYPMIREARERVASGQLGAVRKIIVEYTQGWLSEKLEDTNNPQAVWRTDPERAGKSCCMGDIGVHAFNLTEFVSGLSVTRLNAELNRIVEGRMLDDDGTVLLHFENGARGTLLASQICVGDENNLRLRIYGEKASLDWQQMEPNTLWLKYADKATEMIRTGTGNVGPGASANTRLPAGHPEGYVEAFANLYRTFADEIRATEAGQVIDKTIPGIEDALRGMAFIETAVQSSDDGNVWLEFPEISGG
jgi:predicted dehydrogenase